MLTWSAVNEDTTQRQLEITGPFSVKTDDGLKEEENTSRMAAIGPLSQFSTTKESASKRLTQRSCRQVAVVAATDVIPDVNEPPKQDSVDAGFCGEPFADNGELLSSLSPLLFSMKLCGLYFQREDRHRRRTDDPESNPAMKTTHTSSTWLRVYATVVLILFWFNVVRFASVFNQNDNFGATILKISIFTWFCLVVIFQTAYYYASHTGRLLKILLKLPVTHECVQKVHRAAVGVTVFIWIGIFLDIVVGIYFYFDGNRYDFMLTPFVTYIDVSEDNMMIARVIGYIVYMLVFLGIFFSHAMNQVLVYIFYSQFKKLKRNFRSALGERGQFTGDLSIFRRRHQTLSRAVSKVDGFVKFGNVAGFVCHTANIILLIYSLIFHPETTKSFRTAANYCYLLFGNVHGLLFSASAGIIINHMVRK